MHEDAFNRTRAVVHRRIHKIEVDRLKCTVGAACKLDGELVPDEWLARGVDLVQQLEDSLTFKLRQGLADRPPEHVASCHKVEIARVRERVDVLGATE